MREYRAIVLIAAVGLAGGCSRRAATPAGGAPASANLVVSPAPGAADVQRNAAIGIQFDYPMDSASAASHFALHMGDSSGAIVPGRMMWDSNYRHMTFVPDSMLAPGTTYSIYMRDGMMTRGSMMGGGSGMGGRGSMGGMANTPMMFDHAMAGAMRTGAGMMWSFTTGR
jgi:hypothetical protein